MSKFHVGDRWEDNLGNEWAIIHVGVPVESYPLRVSVCGVDASNFGTVKDLQGEAVTHSLVHRVSPWRSLKDDPPEPPTEDTAHAVLVRAARPIAEDRYRLLVPYQDSDNGNCWRWFESHLDYVLEDLAERGYTEWMEVPQ